jgi:hypothetical protein
VVNRNNSAWISRKFLLLFLVALLVPIASARPISAATRHPLTSVTGLPGFLDLVVDDGRNLVYGSATGSNSVSGHVMALNGNTGAMVWDLSFGANSWPSGMDLGPDGSTLAVALWGMGKIELIDLTNPTTTTPGELVPQGVTGVNQSNNPRDVRYGRAGRLYSVGTPQIGIDYVHVFDTTTKLEVSHSTYITRSNTRLAITSDHNTLYVLDNPYNLEKFDISTDNVQQPVAGNTTGAYNLTLKPDGSQVYTNFGQVFEPGLTYMLGTYDTFGNPPAYAGGISYSGGKLYVSMGSQIAAVDAGGFPYSVVGLLSLTGSAVANSVNAAGTKLYASTDSTFNIIDLTQPFPVPPVHPSQTPYFDLALDEPRGVLYGSDTGAGKVQVINATSGSVIASIDVGAKGWPAGMDVSPDGSRLAVALLGSGQIAIIDLSLRTVVGHMYPPLAEGAAPFDVRYGRAGRLYASASQTSGGFDYLRVFDTSSNLQVGNSTLTNSSRAWLVLSPDRNSAYTIDDYYSAPISKYDITTDSPPSPVQASNNTSHGQLAVRSDGSQLYVSGGQAWSGSLGSLLGTLGAVGPYEAYSATRDELFVTNGTTVAAVAASSPYHTNNVRPLSSSAGPVQVNSSGTTVYVSTAEGVDVITWGTADPPTNLTAVHGNAQATVSWAAPTYTGTSAITGYTVKSSPGGVTTTVGSSTFSATVSPLANGTTYTFTVTANNTTGPSKASAPSNAVTPRAPTVPTAPTNVTASAGIETATINWTPPADDGDSAITGYTVTSSPGGVTATAGPSPSGAVVSPLIPGTSYTFTVTATNGIGTSASSAPSNAVTVLAPTAPGPPTSVTAVAGDGQATVSWSPPVSDGNRPISAYTVTSSPGGVTAGAGGSATSAVVGSLVNGTIYSFTVSATNSIGTGIPSAPSNSVRPFAPTVPNPPANVTAAPGHGQATVSWVAPFDGRSPITGYTVTSSPGGVTAGVGPSATSAVVGPLTNGTTYIFTVTASNAVGPSTPSAPSNAVTPGTPTAPLNVMAIAGVGAATVSWTAPVDSGIQPITSYRIVSSGGAAQTVPSTATQWVIAGLTATPHTFTVIATNAIGDGLTSASSGTVNPEPGGTYHALTPQRLLDTRNGTGSATASPLASGQTINLQVTGRGGVPVGGVSAVILNVTITGPSGSGYMIVFPFGAARPLASSLNFVRGQTVANLVEMAVGSGGKVSLFSSGASTQVIADVEGWVGDATNSFTRDGLFNPVPPTRILDTRTGAGAPLARLGPGQTLSLPVAGIGAVPVSDVSAVVLNVTITNPTSPSWLTVYPGAASRPLASNLNFAAGHTVANRVVVGVDGSGNINIFNGAGSVDVIADVTGWFTTSSSLYGGSAFAGFTPTRIFDSRTPGSGGRLAPGEDLVFTLTGQPVSALVLNVTATRPTTAGHLSLWPMLGVGADFVPPTSDLNFARGQTVANMVVLGMVWGPAFNIYNGPGYVDVIVDEDGFYTQAVPAPPATTGLLAPRLEGIGPRTRSPVSAGATTPGAAPVIRLRSR